MLMMIKKKKIMQVLNMICCWVEDPNSEAYKCHISRIKDYLWVAEDGMKMQVDYPEFNNVNVNYCSPIYMFIR